MHINTIPIKALQCIVLNKQINITGYEKENCVNFSVKLQISINYRAENLLSKEPNFIKYAKI